MSHKKANSNTMVKTVDNILPEKSETKTFSTEMYKEVSVSLPELSSYQMQNHQPSLITDAQVLTDNCDLDTITDEILHHRQNIEQSFLKIGSLLNEAKKGMHHGYWLIWLRDNVDIRIGTAQRLMRIAREFSNNSPVTHLGFTKVSILLTLPEGEREAVLEESHVISGVAKNVAEMTKREFEDVIMQRKINIANKIQAKRDERKSTVNNIPQPAKSKASSDTTLDFDGTIEYIQSCMKGLLEYITEATDDIDKRDELMSAIRYLCEDTLQNIKNTELKISEHVI